MYQFEAIIFDYGNVLSSVPWQSDVEAMARIAGSSKESFENAYWTHRHDYDCGLISSVDYWGRVAEQLQVDISASYVNELTQIDVKSWARPNKQTVEFAYQLQASGIRLSLLSNMPVELKEWAEGPSSWLPRFCHRTYSCDLKVAKPDPAIYEHAIWGLQTKPSNVLFIDDRSENIDGALKCGLNGILFEGYQTIKVLTDMIINPQIAKVPAGETLAGTI